jgi:hypothetical protein
MSGIVRGKKRKRVAKKQSSRPRSRVVLQWLSRSAIAAKKRVASLPWWANVLTVATVVVALYLHVSVVPTVQPDTAISPSWMDLPITVSNSGTFFDLKDVQFFCDMTEQQFESTGETKKWLKYDYYKTTGLIEWPIRQSPLTIPPGNTASFPCNIAANAVMKFNGVPLPMKLIHLSIKTEYNVNLGLLRWHRQAKSQTFTWEQVSGGWQWLPGETLPGPN